MKNIPENPIPKNAYEVVYRDGNLSWKLLTPNPVLQHAKDHHMEVSISNALFLASYGCSERIGAYHSGLELWEPIHHDEIPFSELAKTYASIGVLTIGLDTLVLFPTHFDLLGFLSQFTGAFMLPYLSKITDAIDSNKHAVRILSANESS
jgi:hypothetical protein